MNDPFDLLRDQLVAASRPQPRAGRARRRGGLALVALACALSAVAVAVALGDRSPPRVAVPPVASPSPAPSPAAIEFALRPDLTAGQIGWCGSLAGGSGCGPAASPQRALIAGGALGSPGGGTFYAVVNERVATVVLGGRRFVPRPDPRVPAPWKLVLVEVGRELGPDMRFLDAAGREVPNVDPRGSWPTTRSSYPTRKADPDGPCRMRVGADSPFRVRSTSVMSALPPGRDDVARPAFLACATTVYYLGNLRLRASILLNAHDPSGPAPLLPGMAAEPADIVATGRFTSARRAGDGWVMIYGKGEKQRAQLLRALTVQAP